tara:strand:+ start:218 stop:1039 length:822 start_codon:yes stop_codon:yes gene_type:complete
MSLSTKNEDEFQDELAQISQQMEHTKLENNIQNTINSNTAKNGLDTEYYIKDMLNDKLKDPFSQYVQTNDIGQFEKLEGTKKTDVTDDNFCKLQVKRIQAGFNQVDRHWVDDLIISIPELEPVAFMLKNLCEIPLLENNKFVDKSKGRKNLSTNYYTEEELELLINTLNSCKLKILKYAFLGNEYSPNYLCGVIINKKNKKKEKIIIYKMNDVINHISQDNFEIANRKTVINLGKCFSMQRKGGDCGRKTGNQIACKLKFLELNIENCFSYAL